ncbi:MAG: UbiA family prenyltransferase [Methanobacteriaceae archaeon]|nr:UbiA family prenyltransferase [Methanobacteriaceae archaeon]
MNVYIKILRPMNAFMATIAVLLMALINDFYNLNIIIGALSVFIITGAGNVINDYYDYNIDVINKPERPLPSGEMSLKTAKWYAIILFLFGVIMGFMINISTGIITILSSIILVLYAYSFKMQCLIGNISVALLTGLTFVYGGVIVNNINLSIILGFFAFLMTFAREIIKDMEDIIGDLKENGKTFPIVYGSKKSSILSASLIILTCILSPILYYLKIFNIYYIMILVISLIIFLYSAYTVLKDQSNSNLHKISKYMKIAMFITFIAFVVGSPILTGI